jgi:Domain of unknown function (DUF4386)
VHPSQADRCPSSPGLAHRPRGPPAAAHPLEREPRRDRPRYRGLGALGAIGPGIDRQRLPVPNAAKGRLTVNQRTAPTDPATPAPGRLTHGEWMLLAVAALAFLHHVDHVLRADNSGWPFTPDVTAFTISLLVYPILLLDFLLLRSRPWIRVALVAGLFVALQVAHAVYETPADQYGTWANGVSSVPHALGRPNLLHTASPALGVLSVAVSALLSVAVLVALVLLIREARATHRRQPRSPHRMRGGVTAQPASSAGWILRIGAAAGIAGALLGMVGNLAHPATPAASQDPQGLARTIADSGSWVPDHLAILLGLILMLGGLVAIAHSIRGGIPGALAWLGDIAAVAGVTVGLVLLIIDGVAAKHLAQAWTTAPSGEQAAALHALLAEEAINFALGTLFYILFAGVTFVLLGLAVAWSGVYPRWLGWMVVVAGVGSVVVGLVQGQVGETNEVTRIPSIVFPTVITLWLAWMGVLLLRKAPALERTLPRQIAAWPAHADSTGRPASKER